MKKLFIFILIILIAVALYFYTNFDIKNETIVSNEVEITEQTEFKEKESESVDDREEHVFISGFSTEAGKEYVTIDPVKLIFGLQKCQDQGDTMGPNGYCIINKDVELQTVEIAYDAAVYISYPSGPVSIALDDLKLRRYEDSLYLMVFQEGVVKKIIEVYLP